MSHATDAVPGSPGRPRAKREQVIRMAAEVEAEIADELVVRLRSGTTDRWRRVGTDLWELRESIPTKC